EDSLLVLPPEHNALIAGGEGRDRQGPTSRDSAKRTRTRHAAGAHRAKRYAQNEPNETRWRAGTVHECRGEWSWHVHRGPSPRGSCAPSPAARPFARCGHDTRIQWRATPRAECSFPHGSSRRNGLARDTAESPRPPPAEFRDVRS